jgi:HlyD family secretion protein
MESSSSEERSMIGMRHFALPLLCLFTLAACSQEPTPTPTPAATTIPAIGVSAGGGATASGEVVPALTADLSFPAAGQVQTIAVEVGETVAAGTPLVELDDGDAEAAVQQAEAELFQAQALLSELQNGARPQELDAAQATLDQAQARLAQLTEGGRPEEVAAAEADLAAAMAAQGQLYSDPRSDERIAAQVELANAEAARRQAQRAYDKVSWRGDVGATEESRVLQQATNDYEAAQARFDALYAGPDADEAAEARARVQRAQASLDGLMGAATDAQIAELEAQVRSAQAAYDLLAAGPRDETLAMAAVEVSHAEAALARARVKLAQTTLLAPFAGTVTSLAVNPGEIAQPGETVLTLADLDKLQVETTDLSERDVARVDVGQPVVILVEALGEEYGGRVTLISPKSNTIGGDVVYPVTIEFDDQPPGIRWGMSVEVNIQGE